MERIDVTVKSASRDPLTVCLVKKWTWQHEVLGLLAAQAVAGVAPAIPVLLERGEDEHGHWLITPFYVGNRGAKASIPPSVFESLALLHARYAKDWMDLSGIPVVDSDWWRDICLSYALPVVDKHAAGNPYPVLDRAKAVLTAAANDARIVEVLDRLPRTLLHGDVHPGNILVAADRSTLVDWGSSRIGPPMLDLANVTERDSTQFTAYAKAWEGATGSPLDSAEVELGYLWAAVQIPIQYLAWVVSARSLADVAATLDQAETGLSALPAH